MKVPFYILGLLQQYGPQHGYRLKQIIEERISDFAKIKLPTIYYHLDKLKEKGYVTEILEKDGNRPEKFVYSITSSGKKYFDILFVKQLEESYSPEFLLDGVLYFSENIDTKELRKAFNNKKQEILIKLEKLRRHKSSTLSMLQQQGSFSATAIFDHHIYHLEAELKWLQKVMEGLEK
ncbi:PadR family transcriptional regulator [Clostridium botulinum]|nr:PadR family transcriptional regulator [Clostridium botulinum]